jgi:hypothetical protein
MNQDEPLATTPPRGATIRTLVILLAAFLAGIAALALVLRFYDVPGLEPATVPAATGQPIAADTRPVLPAGTDIAALYARELALGTKIDQLEARLAGIDSDARTAAGYATRSEGLLVAFAARRALDRGMPLGYVEGQLGDRFRATEPLAVATVIRVAREPVTLEDLRLALDTIAPHLVTGNPGEGMWTKLRRQFNTLIVLRRESSPSPRLQERMTRARRLLDAGHVEASLAEVARLPGAGAAASWMAAATRYVDARRALNTLELAAIQGRSGAAAAPSAPPEPTL